ncbi:hypothetical protein C2S53_017432 [Perilla frutescens var. hirtella]|uniref:Uncharacterized protein n=1 Tax=Perilla frutescens var. hirtella TaxID=608512 RepID=A0AAD4IS24_PERFH|nr:hypothetical protein C2S53_017432 [Perilla frutescens var. hirtella]
MAAPRVALQEPFRRRARSARTRHLLGEFYRSSNGEEHTNRERTSQMRRRLGFWSPASREDCLSESNNTESSIPKSISVKKEPAHD